MYKKGRLFIDNLGSFNAKIDLEVELNIQVNLALQYVRLIGEHVARSGTSVNSWLEQSGISREEFDAPGFSTNFTTFRRLTLDAIQLTREPALGLVIGEQLGVHARPAGDRPIAPSMKLLGEKSPSAKLNTPSMASGIRTGGVRCPRCVGPGCSVTVSLYLPPVRELPRPDLIVTKKKIAVTLKQLHHQTLHLQLH